MSLSQGKELFRIIMEKIDQYITLNKEEIVYSESYVCPIDSENQCLQDPIMIKAKLAGGSHAETEIVVDRRNLFVAQHKNSDMVSTVTYCNQEYLVPMPRHRARVRASICMSSTLILFYYCK